MTVKENRVKKPPGRRRPWGQDRRLEFIESRLLWEGKINRGEVAEFFGISIQQALLDFARYLVLAEDNMEYDRREKVYRAAPSFTPLFIAPDTQTYLNELSGLANGTISPSVSFVGTHPPCDVVTLPVRRVRPELLLPVVWAIRDGSEIEVLYQSMSSPGPTRHWIVPHALAFDGTRWHTRAWCHGTSRFRDFVLTRIQDVYGQRPTTINSHDDKDWNTFFVVQIEPNPTLTISQRDSVVTDFGMDNGHLQKTIRRALVPYFVRHLRIDSTHYNQPIVWANSHQFEDGVAPSNSLPRLEDTSEGERENV